MEWKVGYAGKVTHTAALNTSSNIISNIMEQLSIPALEHISLGTLDSRGDLVSATHTHTHTHTQTSKGMLGGVR